MFKATKLISDKFTERGLKFRVEDGSDRSVLRAGFSGDNFSSIEAVYISTDNDNDVAFRIWRIVRVPEGKRAQLLNAVNEMNRKYRYLKFVLDGDGDINAEFDFPVKCEMVGDIAVELASRAVNILDEAYPVFMKELWS